MTDSLHRPRFNILRVEDVLGLPDPEWHIEGVLELGALGCLFGPPGEGKSFLAMAWAMSIAASIPWNGRAVVPGRVIYIATEGGTGIKKRIRAWLKHHGRKEVPDAFMLLESIELRDDVDQLIAKIGELKIGPSLIVIDTLARSFSGDENSSAEMGTYIRAAQRLQEEVGRRRCTVLLIHHTGKKDKKGARGSSALLAGVDVMISVSKNDDSVVTIKNEKQKDDAAFKDIKLVLTTVDVGVSLAGHPITSCVLEAADAHREARPERLLNAQQRSAIEVLSRLGEAQTGAWRDATAARDQRDIPADTFEKWRRVLVDGGYVESIDRNVPKRYRVTELGASAIGASTNAKQLDSTSVSHATTPEGVARAAGDYRRADDAA